MATKITNGEFNMKPAERFKTALKHKTRPDRVPHFELVFFLTMEAFGKVHPSHRSYGQWGQMTRTEQTLHLKDIASIYVETAKKFEHDAIFIHGNPDTVEVLMRLVDEIKAISGDDYFLMCHGDATFAIPGGNGMEEWSFRMMDEPEKVDAELAKGVDNMIARAEKIKAHGGMDAIALCSDYCFNSGPFLSLEWFDRFIQPNLIRQISAYREMGFYTIKHTDGNIMPILDRLLEAGPDAIHSLDPQGGVDIAEVATRVGDKVTLIGNVDCGKLQTGTDEECIESALYAIENGKRAAGYIFSTSNCVYTGMELRRYELIRDVWKKHRDY